MDQLTSFTRGSVFDGYEQHHHFFANNDTSEDEFSLSKDELETRNHSSYSGSDSESLPEYDLAYTKEVSRHFTEVESENKDQRSESPILTDIKNYHDDLFEAIRRSLLEGGTQRVSQYLLIIKIACFITLQF